MEAGANERSIRLGRRAIAPEAAVVALAAAVFVLLSAWWLLYDNRLPGGGDPGRHLSTTLAYADLLAAGDLGSIVSLDGDPDGFFYPPLARLVGAVPGALGLAVEDWGTIALNLVFVPLLAAGCYGIGRRTYGPRAGMLAAIFALGSPIVLSMFHVFLLDAPLAAMVAVATWALLASERFGKRRESVLAGVLIGLAILVKTAAPLFVVGPIVVMLLGGGWRRWQNVLLMLVAALVVAAPYHLVHLDTVLDVSEQSAGPGAGATAFGAYSKYSLENLVWYGWVALNIQYLAPLVGLFLVGLVAAVRELRQRPNVAELLAGLVVGYLAATLVLSIRDPRYTLPLIAFAAVIATGWIATSGRRWVRVAGSAVLAVAIAANVAAATVGAPEIKLNGTDEGFGDLAEPGAVTFLDDRGYVVGVPRDNPLWQDLLDAAERDGLKTAAITVRESPLWGIDDLGFDVAAEQHDITTASFSETPPHHPDLRVNVWYAPDRYWVRERGLARPCGRIGDGTNAPAGSDAVAVAVSVERLGADGYERWCEFLG